MTEIRLKDSSRAHILIRAANWVGDAVMTTPVVRAVRSNFPRARITVLAKPWVVPVYQNNPHVDHVMVYENQGRHKMGLGTLRLAKDMRFQRFDLAILMQNAFEAALLAFLARIPERLGYNTDARAMLLNRCIKMDPSLKKGHLIDYYLAILSSAGLDIAGRELELYPDPRDREWVQRFLDEQALSGPGRPVLGINPGATGGTAKRWFPERYAQLASGLAARHQTRVIIFGGPADRELGDEICAMAQGACINMAGRTSLSKAFALIGALNLFVTNDSGLMHVAAALNVNQVAVIGSTDHIATAPANKNSVIVRQPVPCSPCLKKQCPTDHKCMDKITVDMVMAPCNSFLEKEGFNG